MSVFSEIPAGEWIASNRSAFAIFDRFPVTEGHALVVPRKAVDMAASGGRVRHVIR